MWIDANGIHKGKAMPHTLLQPFAVLCYRLTYLFDEHEDMQHCVYLATCNVQWFQYSTYTDLLVRLKCPEWLIGRLYATGQSTKDQGVRLSARVQTTLHL